MVNFQYPAVFEPAEEGGFVVTFRDFPEAITQGEDLNEALEEAADCLEEAVANCVAMSVDLPTPSASQHGERLIPVPASMAITAALYDAIRRKNLTKVEMASILGVDEKEVRRLLDPYHASKLPRVEEALEKIGKRLVVSLQDIEEMAAVAG